MEALEKERDLKAKAYEVWQALAVELARRSELPWSIEFTDFIDAFIDDYESGVGIAELMGEYDRQLMPPPPSKRKRNLTEKLRL